MAGQTVLLCLTSSFLILKKVVSNGIFFFVFLSNHIASMIRKGDRLTDCTTFQAYVLLYSRFKMHVKHVAALGIFLGKLFIPNSCLNENLYWA